MLKTAFKAYATNFTFCLLVLLGSPSIASQNTDFLNDPDHQFWHDNNTLSAITLSLSNQSWEDLLSSSQSNRVEVPANMRFDNYGVEYSLSNIGVKLSGNTSFVLPINSNGDLVQANFTLDFDEFVDDQTLKGVSALKLKRFKDDTTFVHEPLSNQIMQNFGIFTAHSSSYVKVFIQIDVQSKQYIGVYRLNESVNRKEYIDKRFAINNDSGFLWQGNYKAHGPALFSRITENWEGISEEDDASFEYKGKGSKFIEAKEQLLRLANNFNQLEGEAFVEYVNQHINMPLFLKFLAAEAIVGHWDGFWGNANNYMFYVDEQEVIHFIPFDTDNTLGTSAIVQDAGEQAPAQFGVSANTPRLITKILAVDAFLGEFLRNTQALVNEDGLMTQTDSVTFISQIHELIANELPNVTNQNDEIIDRPASWGNQSQYRLFALDTGKNWYSTKLASVTRNLGLPTANAGADIAAAINTVITLDGTQSVDNNGEIVSYEWSNGLSGATPTLTLSTTGTLSVTLTVTDNYGFTSTDSINITTIPFLPVPPPEESSSSSGGAVNWIILCILSFAYFSRRYCNYA